VIRPVLAKHSKHFSLQNALSIGVDQMQRNFEPMRRQVEEWRSRQISTVAAKLIIYQAFVESDLDAPKHLARQVHDLYFRPVHPEFEPRTLWSLSTAFTSAFKELDPMPQFKATSKLAASYSPYRHNLATCLADLATEAVDGARYHAEDGTGPQFHVG